MGKYSSSTTYEAKIGLMYVSDYGFAASPSHWNNIMNEYNSTKNNNNWIFGDTGNVGWTISRESNSSNRVYWIDVEGKANLNLPVNLATIEVRPCFYLNLNVQYISGDGTKNLPIRIN